MRWIRRLLPSWLIAAPGVDCFDMSVFTFNPYPGPPGSRSSTVAESAVQRLVELRMAPPVMSTLGRIDQETVEFLNCFGGMPSPLFGVSSGKENQKTTIILEGIAPEVGSSVQAEQTDTNVISYSSPTFPVENSLGSLLKVKSKNELDPRQKHCTFYASSKGTELYEALKINPQCFSDDHILQGVPGSLEKGLLEHADTVESWVDATRSEIVLKIVVKPLITSSDVVHMTESLRSLLRHLSTASSESKQVTMVLLSSPPNLDKSLRARSLASKESSAKPVNPRFEQQDSIPWALAPICHASKSSCLETTNNCSGHGDCYKKSGSGEATVNDCYTCKCQETIIKKEDGTVQKVQWGGSACQKKDVSSPFFLIAGVIVIGVLAISTAISLLFMVGQDELPSVISAGAGSTRPQK